MQPDLSRRRPTAAATGFPRDSDSLPGTSTYIRIALYSPSWPTACRDGIYGGTGPNWTRTRSFIPTNLQISEVKGLDFRVGEARRELIPACRQPGQLLRQAGVPTAVTSSSSRVTCALGACRGI
jgi:hypothetical protein